MSDFDQVPLNAVDRHVGSRLRARRLLCQMSEEWLADHLEVTIDCLAAFEEGSARINYGQLKIAAQALDVRERYFYAGFGGQGAPASEKKSWLRDVDRWFRDHVSPHEGMFLKAAKQLTGSLEAARDLVHDAYANVLADDRWRTVENPRAYVRRSVTNLAIQRLHRKKVVQIDEYADIDQVAFGDDAPGAQQTLEGRERLRLVMEALDKLPGQCRQVFILRRIDDVSPTDIATRLGINIKTVEGHLARGMVALHKHLETAETSTHMSLRVVSADGSRSVSVKRGRGRDGSR
ncbi:sigma-70 family RNA polymerase sigma factor [Asticcacaulis sp.]|uniref:sigma-70 family RNA polymerase sigma factor n=1 Tax=Asticcacaulis sp. TaxID=1872648 RepID=UPI002CC2B80D|nr:sigma-70 family RNA polymerase sigma factor [Asticcacaulis sp.]HTM81896.1 sigma-70 family RNA polymerase sigma factor [Asticcacaulis sp.]